MYVKNGLDKQNIRKGKYENIADSYAVNHGTSQTINFNVIDWPVLGLSVV